MSDHDVRLRLPPGGGVAQSAGQMPCRIDKLNELETI